MATINEMYREVLAHQAQMRDIPTQEAENAKIAKVITEQTEQHAEEPKAYLGSGGNGGYGYGNVGPYSTFFTPVFNGLFNGEKSEGALGNPMNLLPDYRALRFRAYEAHLTNPDIKIIAGKYFKWIVGNGLKFQCEPDETLLTLEKVTEDMEAFKSNMEAYFPVWCNSPMSDYSGMGNMHQNAKKQYETKWSGGDCLTICRFDENYNLTTQIIDGQHINDPTDINMQETARAAGNTILQGIEMNPVTGKHVAFYVNAIALEPSLSNILSGPASTYVRIEAVGKETGCLMAWMCYGFKLRIDHQRGLSSLAPVLQRAAVMDRFTEATVQTAEEHAKTVYTLVHGKTSDGRNPFIDNIKNNIGTPTTPGGGYAEGTLASKAISVSEDRQVHNLPVDSELKTVSSEAEINYEPFKNGVFEGLSAAMNVPPEVAMQKYNSNYSASRAAINSWGFIIGIERNDLILDYYQPIYNLYLYAHILKGKVSANQYVLAKNQKNFYVVEAYSGAKFSGPVMPHIDPKKEIDSIRTALADDVTPLISFEEAVDQWNGGDWNANVKKVKKEKATLDELGLTPPPVVAATEPPITPKPIET